MSAASAANQPPPLGFSSSEIRWEAMRSDAVALQRVRVLAGGGEWRITRCPWWLDASREGDALVLRPRNCGRHRGVVKIRSDGATARLPVSSDIVPVRPHKRAAGRRGLLGAMLILWPLLPVFLWAITLAGAKRHDALEWWLRAAVIVVPLAVVGWGLFLGSRRLAARCAVGVIAGAVTVAALGTIEAKFIPHGGWFSAAGLSRGSRLLHGLAAFSERSVERVLRSGQHRHPCAVLASFWLTSGAVAGGWWLRAPQCCRRHAHQSAAPRAWDVRRLCHVRSPAAGARPHRHPLAVRAQSHARPHPVRRRPGRLHAGRTACRVGIGGRARERPRCSRDLRVRHSPASAETSGGGVRVATARAGGPGLAPPELWPGKSARAADRASDRSRRPRFRRAALRALGTGTGLRTADDPAQAWRLTLRLRIPVLNRTRFTRRDSLAARWGRSRPGIRTGRHAVRQALGPSGRSGCGRPAEVELRSAIETGLDLDHRPGREPRWHRLSGQRERHHRAAPGRQRKMALPPGPRRFPAADHCR